MKSNLAIKLIIDKEINKAYISIEGKIENATEEEKLELRDTLQRALSQVIGIEPSSETKPAEEIISDFKSVSDEVPDFVEQEFLGSGQAEEAATQNSPQEDVQQPQLENAVPEENIKTWEELMEEFSAKESVELNYPAKYKGLTPYAVLARHEENGYKELEGVIPILEKNKARFPQNEKAIDEIKKALKEYDELKFDCIVAEIKAGGKEVVEVIERACQSRGTTLRTIINTRDREELNIVYNMYKEVKGEKEGK